MSKQVKQQLQAAGMEEDSAYYVGRYGVQGLQYGCLAATPLYFVQVLRGCGFSLRGLARYNWLVPAVGAGVGSAAGYAQASSSDTSVLATKARSWRLDAQRVRQDDLHLIGSVLGALILPALFLRRTGLINGLLGGAGLGGAAGVITHYAQSMTSSSPSPRADANANATAESVQDKAHDLKTSAINAANTAKDRAESALQDARNYTEKQPSRT